MIRLPNAAWLQTTSYPDYSPTPGQHYYYWVRVVTAETEQSYNYMPGSMVTMYQWLTCPTAAERGEESPIRLRVAMTTYPSPLYSIGDLTCRIREDDVLADDTMVEWTQTDVIVNPGEGITWEHTWTKDIVLSDFETSATAEVYSWVRYLHISGISQYNLEDQTSNINVTLRDFSDDPPNNITASQGTYGDRVHVTWDPATGNSDITSGFRGWIGVGSLTLNIEPAGARTAGAQWRVDGASWHNSGYTQTDLLVGQHTVEYKSIAGWNAPSSEDVEIYDDQTTAITGTYTAQTGSLNVTIEPEGARNAGAQWRVDGGSWHNSGYTESGLPVGQHTVEFKSVSGWNTPDNQTVQINAGDTTYTTGTYSLQEPEINIKQDSTNIPDDTGSYDFARVNLGWSEPVTFTIENLGNGNLDLTGSPFVQISGLNADEFVVSQQPSTPVTPGGSVTFEITFSPAEEGQRSATVAIANNDLDENPYNFSLTGTDALPMTIYVDANAPNDPGSGTPEDPYGRIQDAINAALNGDTVIVAEGTYYEGINFNNKNITLSSTAPEDRNVAEATVIVGGCYEGSCWSAVRFVGSENSNCILTGFTITGGIPGGIRGNGTTATISDCIIRNNYISAGDFGGAGLQNCDGTISNCIISNNVGFTGRYDLAGGGLAYCDGTITSCIITENGIEVGHGWEHTYGGGLYRCNGTISNCLIASNWLQGTDWGAGLYGCNGTISNCTIVHNTGLYGDGLRNCTGTISNCIIWGNRFTTYSNSLPTYTCIQNWTGGGEGNINNDPVFVNAPGGNYHLSPDSPCIDAGNNSSVPADSADLDGDGNTTEPTPWDLDGRPRFIDGDCNDTDIVDMGAYEFAYLYLGDFYGGCDVDFADFSILALAWLTEDGQAGWNPDCDIAMPADGIIDGKDLGIFTDNWLLGR